VRALVDPAVTVLKAWDSTHRFLAMAVAYSLPVAGVAYLIAGLPADRRSGLAVGLLGAGYGLALYLMLAWHVQTGTGYRELVKLTGRLTAGDLQYRSERRHIGRVWGLIYQLNDLSGALGETFGQVRVGAETIERAAKSVAAGHVDLSRRTEEQTATLERTAAGMEELAATVRQSAEHCQTANGLSQGASEVAARGADTVHRVAERMGLIDGSAKRIADVIGVIEGIAFQTSILALNAAVEAARAGERGQGFAVVAAEVRSLAERSGGAADEIKGLIEESAANVQEGSRLVEEAGRILDEIVTGVGQVRELTREIAMASIEQSAGVDAIKSALGRLQGVAHENAALVRETTASTLAFEEEAGRLTAAIGRFRFSAGRTA
jgi:methyl-accepting chemotaxis protein